MKTITQQRYGNPDVLSLVERPAPEAGPGEVVVAIHASCVTQGDRRLRSADFPGMTAVFGHLAMGMFGPRRTEPGTNYAGSVVAVGEGASRFAVGDDVLGSSMAGAWAERIVAKADGEIAAMPASLSYEDAAALPYGAITALMFLRDLAKVQAGERVLVVGGSGGVGRYAVQLARHSGAWVTAVASQKNAALCRKMGADAVLDRASDWTATEERWDVVFDTSDTLSYWQARELLEPKGRFLTLGLSLSLLAGMLWSTLRGGPKALWTVAMGKQQEHEDVAALAEEGAIRATVARRFALEDIAAAHTCIEEERPAGEIAILVAQPAALVASETSGKSVRQPGGPALRAVA